MFRDDSFFDVGLLMLLPAWKSDQICLATETQSDTIGAMNKSDATDPSVGSVFEVKFFSAGPLIAGRSA